MDSSTALRKMGIREYVGTQPRVYFDTNTYGNFAKLSPDSQMYWMEKMGLDKVQIVCSLILLDELAKWIHCCKKKLETAKSFERFFDFAGGALPPLLLYTDGSIQPYPLDGDRLAQFGSSIYNARRDCINEVALLTDLLNQSRRTAGVEASKEVGSVDHGIRHMLQEAKSANREYPDELILSVSDSFEKAYNSEEAPEESRLGAALS